MIGGVTALALPVGLPIYSDARLLEMDYIILGAGSRSGKLKMAPKELGKLPGLEFIDGLSIKRGCHSLQAVSQRFDRGDARSGREVLLIVAGSYMTPTPEAHTPPVATHRTSPAGP